MRAALGVSQSGDGVLSHQLNLYFRADLTALVKGREFSMCLVENPEVRGLFASVNNTDLWVLHVPWFPEKGERAEDYSAERCADLVRKAVGLPDLAVEIKGVMPWQSTVRIADGFQHGRVFLAGDSAYVMPPWGGFGANTGIQDAHNLAWKLAAVLAGYAGPGLLSTYEQERRPVARAVAEIAASMNDERGLMFGGSRLRKLWNLRKLYGYVVVGYGYASPAVVLERGPIPGPGTTELRGRPGTRVPHVWLEREGRRLSTLDLCGRRFVLLAGREGNAWIMSARAVANRLGLPLDAFRIGADLQDPDRRWPRAFGVKDEGALLIRPDGMVAWRARQPGGAPEEALTRALMQLLARQGTVDGDQRSAASVAAALRPTTP